MEFGSTQIDPQQLIEMAAVFGGLGVTTILGFLLVRRARAARRRQIEGLGIEPPVAARRVEADRRPKRRQDDVDPDDADGADGADGEKVDGSEESAPEKMAADRARPAEPESARAEVIPPPSPAGPGIGALKHTPPIAKPVPAVPLRAPTAAQPESAAKQKRRDVSALAPGLARTRSGWVSRLGDLFSGKRAIDPALLDEVEKVLLSADIGVRTSGKLLEEMRASLSRRELSDPDSAWAYLRRQTSQLLSLDAPPLAWDRGKPFVLLIVGVNGSGKTTTIGKLAAKLVGDGKKVLVGAGDTFRAAAAEQLEIWANRVGAAMVRGKEGADPSSVLFDAVKRGRAENFDVVIADTAGRLHTKTDLMEELQKVRRVIAKAADGAPHETWLVIDSTNGQNAIAQAQIFTQAMSVSGIVLTKLDGTAKGGVILGIADQLQIPVRFIGIGERVEDLREFDAEEFVEALYQQ
jgi:fused signal recognition particle receptor